MNGILQAIPIYLLFFVFGYTAKVAKTNKRFDVWYSLALILTLYPFFYFIGGTYHSIWYLAPTGFLASYWFSKFFTISKERDEIKKEYYWAFAFVIFILLTGAGVAGMIGMRFWTLPEYTPLIGSKTMNAIRIYEGMFFSGFGGTLLYSVRKEEEGLKAIFFFCVPFGVIITLTGLLSLW